MNGNTSYDVYVANIPLDYTENQIREIFTVAGEMHGIKIIPPKAESQGKVAFVKFVNEEDAQCAAQYLNNQQLEDDRNLIVRYRPQSPKSAVPKSPSKDINDVHTNGNTGKSVTSNINGSVSNEVGQVYVVHIESPIQFWAQKFDVALATKMQKITEKMEKLCATQPKVIGKLSTQQLYGCKFSEDNMWYRCCIERCLVKNMVQVRYIDYGNCETIERFGLVTLPADLATIPGMATCYRVGSLELVDTDNQSELFTKGTQVLTELISDQTVQLKVKQTENNVHIVQECKILDGVLLDIPTRLLPSGSVKVKMESSETPFSVPSKSAFKGKTPFSNVKNTSLMPPAASLNTVTIQIYKDKAENCAKEVESKQVEINNLKSELEKKTVQYDEVLETSVAIKFNGLINKVMELRRMRKTVPLGGDMFSSDLESKVDLFMNSQDAIDLASMKPYHYVITTEAGLNQQQQLIVTCSEKELLSELIESRDKIMRRYIRDIKSFLKHIDLLPLDKRETDLKTALKEISLEHQNILSGIIEHPNLIHTNTEASLEIAVNLYETVKADKCSSMQKLQQSANEKSNKLFKAFGQVQRECHCVVADVNGSVDENLDVLIQEYQKAIEEEISCIGAFEKEFKSTSTLKDVIVELARALKSEIHDIDTIRNKLVIEYGELKEKYEEMLQNKPDTNAIMQIRKQIKSLKSKFRHKLADITDMEEDSEEVDQSDLKELEEELQAIRLQLHTQFIKEHDTMKSLSSSCLADFPELQVQHPELALDAFQESNCLMQKSRIIEHYCHSAMPILGLQRKQTTYKTLFSAEPCVIKEISIDGKSLQFKDLLSRVVEYSKTTADGWMDINCVFPDKSGRKLYIHQKFMEGNLKDFLEARKPVKNVIENLLKDILAALNRRRIPYCALKPQNVLVEKINDGYRAVLADPNFIVTQEKQLNACLYIHKVIQGYPVLDMFQEQPSHKADMVCFGGLVLWALHGETSFSNNIHSDLEIIVQDSQLKDVLRQILNPTSSERLSAEDALKHPFFHDMASIEDAMAEAAKENSGEVDVPLEQTENDNVTALDAEVSVNANDGNGDQEEDAEEDEDASPEIDGWTNALANKKKSFLAAVLEEKPQDVSITDDDDDF